VRLVVIATLFALATIWHRETTLDHSATFGAALVGVVTWMIGGWQWLPAPAALYFGYTLLWPSSARVDVDASGPPTLHTVHNVLGVASVGMGWLFLSVADLSVSLLYPYTLSYAAYLGLIGVERLRSFPHPVSTARILADSTLKSSVALLGPLLVVEGLDLRAFLLAGGLVTCVMLTALLYLQWPHLFETARSPFRVQMHRALLVGSTSALGLSFMIGSATLL
jgi:hypothetical protein